MLNGTSFLGSNHKSEITISKEYTVYIEVGKLEQKIYYFIYF